MAWFSPFFRKVMRHSIESTLYAIFWFVVAYGLTVAEDYAKATGRPDWFVFGVLVLSIAAFVADAIVWLLLILLGLKYLWKKFTK